MKIVVLDALPATDGLDTAALAACGELVVFDATPAEETAAHVTGAQIVVTNKVRLGAPEMDAAPELKLIAVLATGYDIIDTAAAVSRGIAVCNVRGYSTPSTAQTTIALLLEMTHQAGRHAAAVRAGEWTRRGVWSWWEKAPVELEGKTLAILGMGAIGSRVARIAEALGMRVQAVQLPGRPPRPDRLPLDRVLPEADVVSLHCPLTPQTHRLVDASFLARLKPGARLINIARGPLIDEQAVADALRSGRLAGYAADVLAAEPPPADHPLQRAPNCLLTPHYAWASRAARERLLAETVENIRAFLAGAPRNVVAGP